MGSTENLGPTPTGDHSGVHRVRTLGAIVEQARWDQALRRDDVAFGDRITVRTRNSVYSLWSLGDGRFAVSGGWFDAQSSTPTVVTVNGCTYGGTVIRQDVVAARGLFMEFGNNVSTTRITDVRLARHRDGEMPPTA